MKELKAQSNIKSLKGGIDEITVLDETMNGEQKIYIVDYRGVKCTAIFNVFTNSFYTDDVYGRLEK